MSEYDTHMGVKKTVQVLGPKGAIQANVIGNFGLQSMQELVDRKVLMAMAKEQGVLPTQQEVEDELKLQIKLRPDYEVELGSAGISHETILKELEVGLAREHLIMKGVEVKPDEIDKYIKANPAQFTDPAQAVVLYIQLTSPVNEAVVDAELKKGRPFAEVAKQYSEAAHAKETGGMLGIAVIDSMPKEIQPIVNKTAQGQTSEWAHLGKAYYKFHVDKKIAAVVKPATPEQRELVRRRLAMQTGLGKNDFDNQFYKKLKDAKVDVSVPYLKDPWQKSWDQMSTPTGGPAPKPLH